ncbi:MAG: hypothetical protein JWM21_1880 [Acidobacteria bacterium]|nr:hypothetical protein [Acidobacteriota bacterium]
MALSPPYPLIRDGLARARVIPFLGAGASLGGRTPEALWQHGQLGYLPNAWELATHLAQQSQFPPEEAPDLAKVAQYYNAVGGRGALDNELHGIFDCDYPLTPLHAALAAVPANLLIVTTNYDDLIERAFDAASRPYDVVIHTTDPNIGDRLLWREHETGQTHTINANKLDLDLAKTTIIYKMHGAVDRTDAANDQYVITEDDYIDFLTRMTKNKAIPAMFAEPFQTRHFLFLGYGLRDWNLRVVLNRIEKDLRRSKDITSWAIQFKPSQLEHLFWQKRGVELYDKLLDDFVKELAGSLKPAMGTNK